MQKQNNENISIFLLLVPRTQLSTSAPRKTSMLHAIPTSGGHPLVCVSLPVPTTPTPTITPPPIQKGRQHHVPRSHASGPLSRVKLTETMEHECTSVLKRRCFTDSPPSTPDTHTSKRSTVVVIGTLQLNTSRERERERDETLRPANAGK